MRLRVIGSGTNLVSPNRYPSCYYVETTNEKILLDMGSHTSRRLAEYGVQLREIDHIFISHPHPDHIGDLIPGLLSMFLANVWFEGQVRDKPIHLWGYPGFTDHYETLRQIMFPDRPEQYSLEVSDLHDEQEVDLNGTKVKVRTIPHMEDYSRAIALRLTDQQNDFTYSGDSPACPELTELARQTHLALFEAGLSSVSYSGQSPTYGHMHPQSAASVARTAGAHRLVLTHISDGIEPEEEQVLAAREHFNGPIQIAHDGDWLL